MRPPAAPEAIRQRVPAAARRRAGSTRASGVPDAAGPGREQPEAMQEGVAHRAGVGTDARRGGEPHAQHLRAAKGPRPGLHRHRAQARLSLRRGHGRADAGHGQPGCLPGVHRWPVSLEPAQRGGLAGGHGGLRPGDRDGSDLRSRLLRACGLVHSAWLSQLPRSARGFREGEGGGADRGASGWRPQ